MPRGTVNILVEELPQGDETSGMTLEGSGVPGADRRGRGGDGKSPSTQDTKGSRNTSRKEEMASGKEPAAPPSTNWGTSEGERIYVIMQRHPDGADGARPEHGVLARREYSLLAPEETVGNPAATGPQGSGDSPE